MKVYPEGDQTAGHKGDEDLGQSHLGMVNIRCSRKRRCGTLAERENFWSQSCWFLETISERLFRMVLIKPLSTMPSDRGCKGVVHPANSGSSSRHSPSIPQRRNFFPIE
ncbi:hypothetical protein TNCV_2679601 [Trichonephila clavipes]|nr:hypothetical protein TNCV_2679601 [Trichonephila clavipes]